MNSERYNIIEWIFLGVMSLSFWTNNAKEFMTVRWLCRCSPDGVLIALQGRIIMFEQIRVYRSAIKQPIKL